MTSLSRGGNSQLGVSNQTAVFFKKDSETSFTFMLALESQCLPVVGGGVLILKNSA